MSLFVIGSSNTDLVLYMNHIPKIGETVVGAESTIIFGGKGANQAVSSKRAGADTKFITQLGNDGFGDELKKHFKKIKNKVTHQFFIPYTWFTTICSK